MHHAFRKFPPVGGWGNAYDRHLQHFRPQTAQARAQFPGLGTGARHHDALAEQRQFFKPVQGLAFFHHIPDDNYCGSAHPGLLHPGGQCFHSSRNRTLNARGGPLDGGGRHRRFLPVPDQGFAHIRQFLHSHQHDFRALRFGYSLQIQGRRLLILAFMARKYGKLRAVPAVRHRNACVSRPRNGGSYARNNFKRDARFMQGVSLLPPRPKT